jgi:hypothetical protein
MDGGDGWVTAGDGIHMQLCALVKGARTLQYVAKNIKLAKCHHFQVTAVYG